MIKHKTFIGLLSAVAVSFGIALTANATIVGDIDNNGSLSPRDALLVLKHVADINIDLTYIVNLETADVYADGVIDAKDALSILTKSTGNENWYPVEPYIEPFSGNVYIMGDSIAADHYAAVSNYERPLYGWGVVFGDYLVDIIEYSVIRNNFAVSSQSTKTYSMGNAYLNCMNKINDDDYVFVAFGHNDHTPAIMSINGNKVDRTTPLGSEDTEGTFQWYLKNYYIEPILEKGGVPILLTAVCRATFDENGVFEEDPEHIQYGQAVVELVEKYRAEGKGVYVIDTQAYTYNQYTELTKEEGGMEEVMSYHGLIGNSASQWNFDYTHYCEKGARNLAKFILKSLKEQNFEITKYIRSDYETYLEN